MESVLSHVNTHNRLNSLQSLCSPTDLELPMAILLISGMDGRQNKYSISLMKYLLLDGSCQELVETSLNGDELEVLDEVILLIQQTSISIFWTRKAKELIGARLRSTCPTLIEYMAAVEDHSDVDKFQLSKCIQFKRMILEAIPAGSIIGVPLPLGYDDVSDTENWPLLQSFAMDDVLCSTGFFSMRYTLVDITENIDVLIRSVDGVALRNAFDVVTKCIVPHFHQLLNILDTSSSEQRYNLTIEDVITPLMILYEFGEMASSTPLDPLLQPKLLAGVDTIHFSTKNADTISIETTHVKDASHILVEACEPGSGMRFCRTIFLLCGHNSMIANDSDVLVTENEENANIITLDNGSSSIRRLKNLYRKLVCVLLWSTRCAFSANSDVLDACTEVQSMVDNLLKGKNTVKDYGYENIQDYHNLVHLLDGTVLDTDAGERLQVHVDCMNALGKVVTIEDVDDMGGQCYVYIRLSVHNVRINNDGELGSIAVGDTFAFSPGVANLFLECDRDVMKKMSSSCPLSEDYHAITAPVPYFRSFTGYGKEDQLSSKLLSTVRNHHLLPSLGLDKPLDDVDGARGGVPLVAFLLTDDPCMPVTTSEIKAFQSGFLITRQDVRTVAKLVSFAVHIEEAWTCDINECAHHAAQLWSNNSSSSGKERKMEDAKSVNELLPNAVVLTLKIRQDYSKIQKIREDERLIDKPLLPTLFANPFDNTDDDGNDTSKPSSSPCQYIAFVIGMDSKEMGKGTMASTLGAWRKAMRLYDIVEHRGVKSSFNNQNNDHKDQIPVPILRAFNSSLGYFTSKRQMPFHSARRVMNAIGGMTTRQQKEAFGADPLEEIESYLSWYDLYSLATGVAQGKCAPGMASMCLNSLFSVGECRRLELLSVTKSIDSNANAGIKASASSSNESINNRSTIVLVGHPGSGVVSIADQLAYRLPDNKNNNYNGGALPIKIIDLSSYTSNSHHISSDSNQNNDNSMQSLFKFASKGNDAERKDSNSKKNEGMGLDMNDILRKYVKDASDYKSSAFITVVITSPLYSVRINSLMDRIHATGVNISSILSVVAAKSVIVQRGLELKNDTKALGLETWICTALTTTFLGCCNHAIIVDTDDGRDRESTKKNIKNEVSLNRKIVDNDEDDDIDEDESNINNKSSFYTLMNHLEACNPVVVNNNNTSRLLSGNARLGSDLIEKLKLQLWKLTNNTKHEIDVDETSASRLIKSIGSAMDGNVSASQLMSWRTSCHDASLKSFPLKRFQCIGFGNKNGNGKSTSSSSSSNRIEIEEPMWDGILLVEFLRWLFPTATVSANCIIDGWTPSVSDNIITPWQRLTQLASRKVLSKLVLSKGRENLQKVLAKYDKNSMSVGKSKKNVSRDDLQVVSIHGFIILQVGGFSYNDMGENNQNSKTKTNLKKAVEHVVVLEASAGAITLRPLENFNNNHIQLGTIHAHGSFDELHINMMSSILQACIPYKLEKREKLSLHDIKKNDLIQFQKGSDHITSMPLPSGWWYDGSNFVDINGNRRELRPDQDVVEKMYLERENLRIDAFNTILDKSALL